MKKYEPEVNLEAVDDLKGIELLIWHLYIEKGVSVKDIYETFSLRRLVVAGIITSIGERIRKDNPEISYDPKQARINKTHEAHMDPRPETAKKKTGNPFKEDTELFVPY